MLYDKKWDEVKVLQPHQKLMLKAAHLLEERGHTKGIRRDSNGSMCVLGALDVAGGFVEMTRDDKKGHDWNLAIRTLSENIKTDEVRHEHEWRCASWNNEASRTADEVISTLKRLAYA